MPELNLSKSEVEAVMDYIWQHVRASPKGKGYKVWKKMFAFVSDEPVDLRKQVEVKEKNAI